MRKRRPGLWILLLLLVCGAAAYFYFHSRGALLPEPSASVPADGRACFLPSCILVPGEPPAAYDTGGGELSAEQAGLDSGDWGTVLRRDAWVLSDGTIYDGASLPLRPVCQVEEGLRIMDFLPLPGDSFLLYAAYEDQPPFMEWVSPGKDPIALNAVGSLTYLAMDCDGDGQASVLLLDATGAAPCTQVLHCRDGEIVGSLTLPNTLFHSVYRLPSHILLVGTHEIVCYNVEDGQAAWTVALPGICKPLILRSGGRILCYLGESAEGLEGNALWVDEKGAYAAASFPQGLTDITAYRDKLAAVQNQSRLMILQKSGAVTAQTALTTDIVDLYWPPSSPQLLYGQTGEGTAVIFGTP